MTLVVGQRIVYPYRGPCRIGSVVKKNIGGRPESFYPLVLMDDSGDVVFVPVDKIGSVGIRQLLKKSQVGKLLRLLREPLEKTKASKERKNWQQRSNDNFDLLASRSAFDLAILIKSLTESDKVRKLSPRDRDVLDKARKHLICEIAEVTGEEKSVIEARIDESGTRI